MALKLRHSHPWDVTIQEAIGIQSRLRDYVVCRDCLDVKVRTVAGIDVGIDRKGRLARAAVAKLHLPDLGLEGRAVASASLTFPYVPGLLSFREAPAILRAIEALGQLPDVLVCDGQGFAHPRRFGIACHLGVLTDLPSIGVAKTRLIGEHGAVPDERGAWVPLLDKGEVIGAVLRSRKGVKPIFVSVGHCFGLESAVELVMACTTRYRLPETTRCAHRLASS